jgi:hypothetical protein
MRNALAVSLVFTIWLAVVLGCAGSANSRRQSTARTLTQEHRQAIYSTLAAKRYPRPVSLELTDGGWLVATFEISRRAPGGSFEAFGTEALVVIREAMLPYKLVDSYRVTVNGPSPGTGLIRRYGSARFIEGGRVEWQDGV